MKSELPNETKKRGGYGLKLSTRGRYGIHAMFDLALYAQETPQPIKAIAERESIPEAYLEQLIAEIPALREKYGDRAILRAFHFINENKRVKAQTEALRAGDLEAFFDGVLASGNSSFEYLQNVYTTKNVSEQGLSLALALAQYYLAERGGAWRVHGGGFAGTIQAFVPNDLIKEYTDAMKAIFGDDACYVLAIRPFGGVQIF